MNDQNNDIIQQVYSSFGVLPPEQREAAATPEAQDVSEMPVFVDIYQQDVNKAREESKKTVPHGSAMMVKAVAKALIEGDGGEGLAHAYKRAKDDNALYRERGEHDRAEIAKNQYMEERFIPAIETVINYTSPDELLNCKEALSALDEYAFGTGSTKGYTASYIRSAYGDLLGQDLNERFGESDPTVVDAVRRIKFLADSDNVRTAVGLANQIKRQIDNGEHIASDDDYALIGRVSAYAN